MSAVMAHLSYLLVLLCLVGYGNSEIKNKGWWKNTVFYQIYPWSFMDSNDDGIGDLKGITSKLEHFIESGIGAIWLSPIYQSPMVDFGYDISNFREIDSRFGTLTDFTDLTKKAKSLGIKVILDLVPNHTSDKHEWFQKSLKGEKPFDEYYIWKSNRSADNPPNNWISVFSGPAWQYDKNRELWYFHQFEYRQPDLNYANLKVQEEMKEIIKFWLGNGVDGFRIDAVPHIFEDDKLTDEPLSNTTGASDRDYTYLDHIYTTDDPRTYELVKSWRKVLDDWSNDKNEDEKVMMTEAYTSFENTTRYYTFGAHVPFNFKFITDITSSSEPAEFKKVIDTWMEKMPKNSTANWVMGNHDRPRTETRFPGRGDQMTMLAMILPGVAVTYNGEEIGMVDKTDISWEDTKDPRACNAGKDKYQSNSRDPNRTPFQWNDFKNAGFTKGKPWIPIHSNYNELNLQRQKLTKNSHYKVYQALTHLRKTSPAIQVGDLRTKVLADNILAVLRELKNETIILLINFSDVKEWIIDLKSEVIDYDKKKTILLLAGSNLPNITWGEQVDLSNVKIPAKSSIVLSSTNGGASKFISFKPLFILCIAVVFLLI